VPANPYMKLRHITQDFCRTALQHRTLFVEVTIPALLTGSLSMLQRRAFANASVSFQLSCELGAVGINGHGLCRSPSLPCDREDARLAGKRRSADVLPGIKFTNLRPGERLNYPQLRRLIKDQALRARETGKAAAEASSSLAFSSKRSVTIFRSRWFSSVSPSST
jgi:hypothetical protein